MVFEESLLCPKTSAVAFLAVILIKEKQNVAVGVPSVVTNSGPGLATLVSFS
jgi:hypothetical protein